MQTACAYKYLERLNAPAQGNDRGEPQGMPSTATRRRSKPETPVQSAGVLDNIWFGRNLDITGNFGKGGRNWLALPSPLMLPWWILCLGSLWVKWGACKAGVTAVPGRKRSNIPTAVLLRPSWGDVSQSSKVIAVTQGACFLVSIFIYLLKRFTLISWKALIKRVKNSHHESQCNWISPLP